MQNYWFSVLFISDWSNVLVVEQYQMIELYIKKNSMCMFSDVKCSNVCVKDSVKLHIENTHFVVKTTFRLATKVMAYVEVISPVTQVKSTGRITVVNLHHSLSLSF